MWNLLDQESNLCLLYWQADSLPSEPPGKPRRRLRGFITCRIQTQLIRHGSPQINSQGHTVVRRRHKSETLTANTRLRKATLSAGGPGLWFLLSSWEDGESHFSIHSLECVQPWEAIPRIRSRDWDSFLFCHKALVSSGWGTEAPLVLETSGKIQHPCPALDHCIFQALTSSLTRPPAPDSADLSENWTATPALPKVSSRISILNYLEVEFLSSLTII